MGVFGCSKPGEAVDIIHRLYIYIEKEREREREEEEEEENLCSENGSGKAENRKKARTQRPLPFSSASPAD